MAMTIQQAAKVEEKITKEEKSRRLYYAGRYGPGSKPEDPHWSPYDNDNVSSIHNHRSPFALGLYNCRDPPPERKRPEGEPLPWHPIWGDIAPKGYNKAEPKAPDPTPVYPSPPAIGSMPPRSSPSRIPTAKSAAALLEDLTKPPATGASRRSASVADLTDERRATASQAASRRSLRSHLSAASIRSKVQEAVQKEMQKTELDRYHEAQAGKKQRDRQKILDMPLHLRPGVNPIDSGCPCNYVTQQARSLNLPIQMATDPKWSTDIKYMNAKIGKRLEWEKKISASLVGQIIPELHFMPPKDYITEPPTPYFKPGEAHKHRSREQ